MALSGSEFRGTLGLVVNAAGSLVTVTAGAVPLGSVVCGWLTDVDGRLVVNAAAAPVLNGSVIPGLSTDSTGALATVAAPDATAFGAVIPGYLTDVAGRFVAVSGAPVSMLNGLGRVAGGALATV